MKFLFPLILILTITISCKKDSNATNQSSVSFDLKTKHYSYSGVSHCEINDSEDPLTVNIYSWYTETPIQFYLEMDSSIGLDTDIDYYPGSQGVNFNTNYEIGNNYYNESGFKVTFTRIENGTMDGTFSGKISGIDKETGNTLTDSVANGIFKNIPYVTFSN